MSHALQPVGKTPAPPVAGSSGLPCGKRGERRIGPAGRRVLRRRWHTPAAPICLLGPQRVAGLVPWVLVEPGLAFLCGVDISINTQKKESNADLTMLVKDCS